MVMVRHHHMKAAGINFCNKGARAFFDRHGLDWNEFMARGIPEEKLVAIGDAMAMRVVEQARAEWAAARKSQ